MCSTVHTKNSLAVVLRLGSLDVDKAELHGTVKAVVSQRLVRECYSSCSEEVDARDELNRLLDLDKGSWITDPVPVRVPGASDLSEIVMILREGDAQDGL